MAEEYPDPPRGSGEIVNIGNALVMTDRAACQFWAMYFDAEPWQPENVVVSYDPDDPAVVVTDTASGEVKRHSLIEDNPAGSFKDWDK